MFDERGLGMRISFLDPIYNAFAALLAFFYGLVPNMGIAIILVTFVIMAALFPLTAKQARSMLEMQRVQPELKKLQAKYKGDRPKLNEETMKFFQEHKINPLAGCLPLVVQMPIFVALFEVFRRAYLYVPEGSSLYTALCNGVERATCGSSDTPDLPNHLRFLGMDLSASAVDTHASLIAALPFYVLVGLVVLTGFLQSRQSQRNAPNMNPQMAMITKVMPVLFGVISINFPSGLVLYFFMSNLWRVGQQEYILRHYAATRSKGAIDIKGASTDGGGGGLMGRLRGLAAGGSMPPAPETPEEPPEETPPRPKPKPKRSGSKNRKRKR
jgi:YidC/Oxa1 family membrane protein insertase